MAEQQAPIHPECRYTESHEWARPLDKAGHAGHCRIGISSHAAAALGEIAFVELPKVGERLAAGDVFGVVESVKSASDLYLPLGGTIVAVNAQLAGQPGLLNSDPYGAGWIIEIRTDNPADLDNLLTPEEYARIT